jgi:hypothetical protein
VNDSRNQDKFVLRLPDGLRPEIASFAQLNQRSMNGEIIIRLQRSLVMEQIRERQNEVIIQLLKRIEAMESMLSETEAVRRSIATSYL